MDFDLEDTPDDESLKRGVATVLGMDEEQAGGLRILSRAQNLYASTSASEVVACRAADGRVMRLLCKYGGRHPTEDHHGHGDRAAYEAVVYRAVLQPLGLTVPRCYGSYREASTGRSWLVLEYLENPLRVSRDPSGEALISAAEWLGRFHAAAEARITAEMPLRRHDAAYYRERARRALEFSAEPTSGWLQRVYERAESFAEPLLRRATTVIHGEFYPQNVLVHDGRVAPVDWETAAVAAGEIDLASLVEGWPARIARRSEQRYLRARWSSQSQRDFEHALAAARVYWPLHWLGDCRGWLPKATRDHYLSDLRAAAERLNLI
jgi:aminoglycoside phosphotransferase (APT) family kinase protein